MTPSELKYQVQARGKESHFFDRSSMRFFGDTMANFGVCAATVRAMVDEIDPLTGKHEYETVEVWELYRKRAVKAGNRASFYFRRDTFARVHCVITG